MKASIVILTTGWAERVVELLKMQTFTDFEIILAREKGIVNAMNKALHQAKGEIFIRLDDDVEMPIEWLENLLEPFKYADVAGVTGPTFVPKVLRNNRDSIRYAENPKGFLKWLYDGNKFRPGGIRKCGCVSYDSNYRERFGDLSSTLHYTCDHLEGTNWAMRTRLIRKVGGFDPKFDGVAEWFDTDVEFKIKKRFGLKLIYNPRAYLFHMLEKGEHFDERFEGFGRIKNWLRFHIRHGRFHVKMIIYLIVWTGYFLWKKYRS